MKGSIIFVFVSDYFKHIYLKYNITDGKYIKKYMIKKRYNQEINKYSVCMINYFWNKILGHQRVNSVTKNACSFPRPKFGSQHSYQVIHYCLILHLQIQNLWHLQESTVTYKCLWTDTWAYMHTYTHTHLNRNK